MLTGDHAAKAAEIALCLIGRDAGMIEHDAIEIQAALAKQGIGEDRITLEQIGLALRGLYTLWDEAGENMDRRMKAEAGKHLTLVSDSEDE
jgi:hypothetical protein